MCKWKSRRKNKLMFFAIYSSKNEIDHKENEEARDTMSIIKSIKNKGKAKQVEGTGCLRGQCNRRS